MKPNSYITAYANRNRIRFSLYNNKNEDNTSKQNDENKTENKVLAYWPEEEYYPSER